MKKFFATFIAFVFVAVSLTGCSANGLQAGSELKIALLGGFNSINADNVTADGSLATNHQVANLLAPSFYFLDSDESLVANKNFGTAKVISKQPFAVRYSLTGNAKWSDGQQVTADDLLLSWLAAKNPLDAGFNSARTGSGLKWATTTPQVSADSMSLTITFDHPVVDYRTSLTVNAAAHIVASKAFALNDNSAALIRLRTSILEANLEDQKLIAEQYAQIYLAKNLGTLAPKVGAGPYLITGFSEGESITLKANGSFNWGPLPRIENIELKFFADSTSMIAAMQAGQVDVAAPQESGIATVADLLALAKSSGLTLNVAGSHDIEAILLNFGEKSIFAGDNQSLREAFLKMVPIAKILSALSVGSPVIEAKSWIYSSTSRFYAPFIEANGSADYAIQNAEQAAEILKQSRTRTPVEVRVLFDSNSPRAKTEFALLGQYANSVGFNLIDVSSRTPRDVYTTGDFDVYITTEALAGEVGGDPYWFTGANVTGFQDQQVDGLLAELTSKAEELDQVSALKKLDAQLYISKFGLPLYQVPSMIAYGKRVKTIVPSPIGSSATYGYWNWAVSN